MKKTASYYEINGHESLALIRRLEAVSFRAFPSGKTYFDGTWAVRLTAGYPARRINSVNPLDPIDTLDLERRIEIAKQRFAGFGRALTFRLTPLAPPILRQILQEKGWWRFDDNLVMLASIQDMNFESAIDQLPLRDTGRWIDDFIALSPHERGHKPGLAEIFASTTAENGLFSHCEMPGQALSVVRCVKDRHLAGIFNLVTDKAHLRKGYGKLVLLSALSWAKRSGAETAWLQVEADNEAAITLYQALGFSTLYHYEYWQPRETSSSDSSRFASNSSSSTGAK